MPSPNDWTTREFPIGIILNLTCSVQSLSHVQLCDPMDFSKPGFPVHHQRPELTQTHICQISDAIQPSRPLSSPLLPPSIFPSIRVFSNESALHIRWPKYWSRMGREQKKKRAHLLKNSALFMHEHIFVCACN